MWRSLFLLTLVALCLSLTAQARPQQDQKPEGAQPYTPTKGEWLAVELQAGSGDRNDDMHLSYINPAKEPNTILIHVRYLPTIDREIMNGRIQSARRIIDIYKKARGWDWIEIKEDIDKLEIEE